VITLRKKAGKQHIQNYVKKLKYSGTYLSMEVKELYTENYESLDKVIEETFKDGKLSHAHG
jgi:DNA integrity scanning protein DisA with diadenylate cyclase activity